MEGRWNFRMARRMYSGIGGSSGGLGDFVSVFSK